MRAFTEELAKVAGKATGESNTERDDAAFLGFKGEPRKMFSDAKDTGRLAASFPRSEDGADVAGTGPNLAAPWALRTAIHVPEKAINRNDKKVAAERTALQHTRDHEEKRKEKTADREETGVKLIEALNRS
eukprot:563166-Pyramimonas_sp.AAC.1